MLKEIRLKNFKCFREETTFPLSTINLLTGINGRGKSTLLQSMLLMKQSVEYNDGYDKMILNGNIIKLGGFDDIKNKHVSSEEDIYFKFIFDNLLNEDNFFIEIKLDKNEGNSRILHQSIEHSQISLSTYYDNILPAFKNDEKALVNHIAKLFDVENIEDINNQNLSSLQKEKIDMAYDLGEEMIYKTILEPFEEITYISADRLGAQKYYERANLNDFTIVDTRGNNIAEILLQFKNSSTRDMLLLNNTENEVLIQVGEWLSKIFDTAIKVKLEEFSHTIDLLFTVNGKDFNPLNVGFGYSYVLPIIVAGLIAQNDTEILIIENPEAHLHPKAQSELTKFLAKVASCGVQIFIESHSEHILNGLRVAIIEEEFEITNEDVNVLYFHDNEDSYFTKIPIKPNGKIEVRKDGFFDQSTKDLDTILGL